MMTRNKKITEILRLERGNRAQGRINGAVLAGRLFRGWFVTMAPGGPLAVHPNDVVDLDVFDPFTTLDGTCPRCGATFFMPDILWYGSSF